jgi:hypothetical protein
MISFPTVPNMSRQKPEFPLEEGKAPSVGKIITRTLKVAGIQVFRAFTFTAMAS